MRTHHANTRGSCCGRYQVHLLEERKLGVGTVVSHIAALRFFYLKTLKRPAMKEDLPYPNRQRLRLPTILTPEEVSRLIDAARNLFHYAMLLTMYSAGLRRSELCKLKVSNIDSGRMVIRIERGKGGVDREVPLNPKLLTTLREYWRWMRPKTYLFPGTRNGWRADKPITPKVIWEAVQHAARKAGIQKHVTHHSETPSLPGSFFNLCTGKTGSSMSNKRCRGRNLCFAIWAAIPIALPSAITG